MVYVPPAKKKRIKYRDKGFTLRVLASMSLVYTIIDMVRADAVIKHCKKKEMEQLLYKFKIDFVYFM